MSLHGNIRARLLAVPVVTDQVGTRIYALRLPLNAVMPALTFQRISTRQFGSHAAGASLAASRWQFTGWGTSYNSANDVAEAARVALDGWKDPIAGIDRVQAGIVAGQGEQFDTESERYMAFVDVFLWASQTVAA